MSAHEFTDLAAIITIDVPEGDTLHNLAFLVWRDCATSITFPSGWKADFKPSRADLEATINDLNVEVFSNGLYVFWCWVSTGTLQCRDMHRRPDDRSRMGGYRGSDSRSRIGRPCPWQRQDGRLRRPI